MDDVTERHPVATARSPHEPARSPGAAAGAGRHRAPVGRTPADRRRLWLLVTSELVLTASVLSLLYLVWSLVVDDRIVAADQQDAAIERLAEWDDGPLTAPGAPTAPDAATELDPGETFAVIRVPRFGDDWVRPVIEGTSSAELNRGVGHYPGTALAGQVGNFSVAGHRLTHGSAFTRIAELEVGDVVGVRTATTWFVYRVRASEIVEPGRVEVIAPVAGAPGVAPTEAAMTLTSCHPLYGSSQRYVVHATLVETQPAADGVPDELLEAVA